MLTRLTLSKPGRDALAGTDRGLVRASEKLGLVFALADVRVTPEPGEAHVETEHHAQAG
jgi:hypothetical protein